MFLELKTLGKFSVIPPPVIWAIALIALVLLSKEIIVFTYIFVGFKSSSLKVNSLNGVLESNCVF